MSPNAAEAATIITSHIRFHPRDDAADWERLPDLPLSHELMDACATTDDLPWFPATDHRWQKIEYLETLYKILRFEGIEGLRYSIKTFRDVPNMLDDDNTCIYTKVRVQGYLFTKMGPIARISFSTKRAGARIKWNQSKRLQAGKIVALSTDFFKADCRVGIVAQRPIEGGLDQTPPVIDIIWGDIDQAVIDPDQDLVMVESRNGYYEAVRHTLKGLQHASQEWSTIDKYIHLHDDEDQNYSSVPTKFDLSSLVDHLTSEQTGQAGNDHTKQLMLREIEDRFRECELGARELEAVKPYTSLDDSQLEALERIVSKELAIVQGPPGTGKTFTSVKSIKVLLQNRQPGDPPIIVAAQTNHALDQLLIYCLAAGANIMRVGGRTENDDIAKRTIYELRRAVMGKLSTYSQYGALEKQRRKISERFQITVNRVFGGDGTGLLDARSLLKAGVITQAQHDSLTDDGWEGDDDIPAMETWLGEEKIKRIQQRVDDLDFEDVEAADEAVELEDNIDDQIEDEDDRILGTFVKLSDHEQLTGQTPQTAGWERRCRKLLQQKDNLFDIPIGIRGGAYQILQSKLRESASGRFREILREAVKTAQSLKINCWTRDLHVIDKHCIDIIGCTTTGLNKYRGFLAAMKPRTLLIEEAAETREANITSALYPSIQQLILVGDHQQLPPSCDIARLAREPYNLNLSLFERLVNNGLPYTMLNRQRRMAPELRYIVQKFYPNLRDHPLVADMTKRPLIPGLGNKRSFFFTHSWPEDTDADNSKYNRQEVEMVVAFVRYLLNNGVKASEITILTYYKGQRRKVHQRLRQKDIPANNFFNVATVDSYQGEENEIVILSLVRSPQPGRDWNVGFLESRNRATVAVSRARRGFFMFGNKDNLLQSNLDSFNTWGPVWNGFSEQGRVAMGRGLPLVCQNHDEEIWVKDADGFVGNAGGCWRKCSGRLSCGHACTLMCHNTAHDRLPCYQACARVLLCGHKCSGFCSDDCRCAENCPDFSQIQLNMQMARLQASGSRDSSHEPGRMMAINSSSQASSGNRRRSPAKWQALAQNPEAHDDAMREIHIQDLQEMQKTILQDGGDSTAAPFEKEKIQDTYIPVSNVGGNRIQGKKQTTDISKKSRCMEAKVRLTNINAGSRQVQQQLQNVARPVNKRLRKSTGNNNNFYSRGTDPQQQQPRQQKGFDRHHNVEFLNKRHLPINVNTGPQMGLNTSYRVSSNQWAARDPLYNSMPFHGCAAGLDVNNAADSAGGADDTESLLINFGEDDAGSIPESPESQSQAGFGTNDTEQSSDGGAAGTKKAGKTMLIDF